MRVVVDASTIGALILPDEAEHDSPMLERMLLDAELVQPAHWPIELAGLVLRASRRNRLPVAVRANVRDQIALLIAAAQIEFRSTAMAAFDLAVEHHISVYDAAYLELALRFRLPMMTRDGPLRRAATEAGVTLQ